MVASVTIPKYKGGEDKDLQMLVRGAEEIDDCEKGKLVILIGADNSQWTGTFVGVDDENAIIKSLESESQIGLPLDGLVCFLEELEEIEE